MKENNARRCSRRSLLPRVDRERIYTRGRLADYLNFLKTRNVFFIIPNRSRGIKVCRDSWIIHSAQDYSWTETSILSPSSRYDLRRSYSEPRNIAIASMDIARRKLVRKPRAGCSIDYSTDARTGGGVGQVRCLRNAFVRSVHTPSYDR